MLLQVLGYSGSTECLTGQPADALEGKNRLEAVRLALVLPDVLVEHEMVVADPAYHDPFPL